MRWSGGAGRWPLVRWCWFMVADALMVASCGRCAGFFGAGLVDGGRWSMVLVYALAGALWWPLVLVALMAADVLVMRW